MRVHQHYIEKTHQTNSKIDSSDSSDSESLNGIEILNKAKEGEMEETDNKPKEKEKGEKVAKESDGSDSDNHIAKSGDESKETQQKHPLDCEPTSFTGSSFSDTFVTQRNLPVVVFNVRFFCLSSMNVEDMCLIF